MTTPRPNPKRLEEIRRIAEHVGFEDHLFAEIERHRKAEEKFVDLIRAWAGVPEEQK